MLKRSHEIGLLDLTEDVVQAQARPSKNQAPASGALFRKPTLPTAAPAMSPGKAPRIGSPKVTHMSRTAEALRIAADKELCETLVLFSSVTARSMRILKLAHVSGPRVVREQRHHFGLESYEISFVFGVDSLQKRLRQELDIPFALAERRSPDQNDVESVIQILAKRPSPHRGFEIPVRRGDHADVDFHVVVAAHLANHSLLKRSQELDLHGERKLAHFVEKKRTRMSRLEKAHLVLNRARETSALVPEHLTFDQVSGIAPQFTGMKGLSFNGPPS